jgi:hypothetical protein
VPVVVIPVRKRLLVMKNSSMRAGKARNHTELGPTGKVGAEGAGRVKIPQKAAAVPRHF